MHAHTCFADSLSLHPLQALRSIRSDGKTFAAESERTTSGKVKASGDNPIAKAMRTGEQVIITAEDTKNMVRKDIAADFNMQTIRFVPLGDGTVLEYGTPGSNAQKESFMQQLGATYALHWVREGSDFVVKRDFTTAARIKAMRQARGDDKLFATESAKYKLNAEGDGPVAYAVRSGREQIMEKEDLRKMKRYPLIKEFGIKKIHMIPMGDGSVLEYGTPSGEEVALLECLGLLVQEMLLIRTLFSASGLFKFFAVALETLSVLRLIAATEGPLKVLAMLHVSSSASFHFSFSASLSFPFPPLPLRMCDEASAKTYESPLPRIRGPLERFCPSSSVSYSLPCGHQSALASYFSPAVRASSPRPNLPTAQKTLSMSSSPLSGSIQARSCVRLLLARPIF